MKKKMMNMIVLGFVLSVFLWAVHEAARLPTKDAAGKLKAFSELGNCLTLSCAKGISKKDQTLPIDATFKLPAPTPVWPPGDGFASGIIKLGDIQVAQISTFNKVWTSYEGGPDNLGATIFEPTRLPEGFSILGYYSQPNNKPLFGWVLVAKDNSSTSQPALKEPLNYKLIWSSNSTQFSRNSPAYFWLPTPPDGYKAVGNLVTTTLDKPSLDKIRCVRSDLTDQIETFNWIWGPGASSDSNEFNIYEIRPSNRGTKAQGLHVGTFLAQNGGNNSLLSISCLKNANLNLASMPNLQQIQAIVQAYSPIMYLHPDEEYLPSSVNWFFGNGGLLYRRGRESHPVPIQPNGTNLPQDHYNDGSYWLDLPADEANKERVKRGDLQSSQAYLHIKPMFGGAFTDIAFWVYYPFNGPERVKVEFVTISLGKIGEHVGDWEHVTLRVSNFNGELQRVYFSEHSGGTWVDSSELEFKNKNKPIVYSSLHGHALYHKAGVHHQGTDITSKSKIIMDMGVGYEVISVKYLGSQIVEPPWLNYFREWGPVISYDIAKELKKVKWLPGKLKKFLDNIVNSLPSEVLGEEGPTGPKVKSNWNGDEDDNNHQFSPWKLSSSAISTPEDTDQLEE
ncbi:uncharacterized protein LOC114744826 [Neltuma alba]|uniref:uncharacterized protein LOC114744826 n=1 Tax=Neltuma alba TaxID=207710 RepID=UPI0010A5A123|nr:uncharacterized protein LOC114744826 [Prosopis alba]